MSELLDPKEALRRFDFTAATVRLHEGPLPKERGPLSYEEGIRVVLQIARHIIEAWDRDNWPNKENNERHTTGVR